MPPVTQGTFTCKPARPLRFGSRVYLAASLHFLWKDEHGHAHISLPRGKIARSNFIGSAAITTSHDWFDGSRVAIMDSMCGTHSLYHCIDVNIAIITVSRCTVCIGF